MPKYVASCSGGKDSVAMVLKLIETNAPLDYVVFYNSGVEFSAVYQVIEELCDRLPSSVKFIELSPKSDFLFNQNEKEVRKRDGTITNGYGWCGRRCRWGTTFKVAAIKEFHKSLNADIIQYIGIAADEPDRIKDDTSIIYPLVQFGMSEADCLRYCHANGIYWNEPTIKTLSGYIELYDILDRVSCWCCANKNIRELRHIHEYLPQYWERLEELDRAAPHPIHGYYNGIPINIAYYHARFEIEDAQMSLFDQELN